MQERPDSKMTLTREQRIEKYSRIVHCEVNALIHTHEPILGYILYTYPFACCDRCVVQMLQAGIIRFVFPEPTADALSRWGDSLKKSKQYIEECGATYEEVNFEN